MKVWDNRAGIQLGTPGSAVRLASVTRHVTECASRPGLPDLLNYVKIGQGQLRLIID